MNALQKILVIVGPTASGKSALSQLIARHLPSEIISADSRQLYRLLDIGTAKPTPDERHTAPHHFIDHRDPDQPFNAGNFQEEGRVVIDGILRRQRLPVIVGGTGLYVQAIVDGFFELPKISGEIRKNLESRLTREGKEALYNELTRIDPVSASAMDATKYRRVIRALEVFYETGMPISEFHEKHTVPQRYDARLIGLQWERSILYERINNRVDEMLRIGFLDEVENLLRLGYDDRFQSLQTVGYREAFLYLRREISLDRMTELMKQNTRRFAKRQMTWFRKDPRITWYPISDINELKGIADRILGSLSSPPLDVTSLR